MLVTRIVESVMKRRPASLAQSAGPVGSGPVEADQSDRLEWRQQLQTDVLGAARTALARVRTCTRVCSGMQSSASRPADEQMARLWVGTVGGAVWAMEAALAVLMLPGSLEDMVNSLSDVLRDLGDALQPLLDAHMSTWSLLSGELLRSLGLQPMRRTRYPEYLANPHDELMEYLDTMECCAVKIACDRGTRCAYKMMACVANTLMAAAPSKLRQDVNAKAAALLRQWCAPNAAWSAEDRRRVGELVWCMLPCLVRLGIAHFVVPPLFTFMSFPGGDEDVALALSAVSTSADVAARVDLPEIPGMSGSPTPALMRALLDSHSDAMLGRIRGDSGFARGFMARAAAQSGRQEKRRGKESGRQDKLAVVMAAAECSSSSSSSVVGEALLAAASAQVEDCPICFEEPTFGGARLVVLDCVQPVRRSPTTAAQWGASPHVICARCWDAIGSVSRDGIAACPMCRSVCGAWDAEGLQQQFA
jgi:hypothetical protein